MSQESLESITTKINNDFTGAMMELGFAFVGRCNCAKCNQDKYAKGEYLIKVCRMRREYSFYVNGHAHNENESFESLLTTLTTHGIIRTT